MHLVICNISKKPNVKQLLTIAASFECESVFVVGQRSFDFTEDGLDLPSGLRGRLEALPIHRFDKWDDFVAHIRSRNIRLVGVEIHAEAKTIADFFDDVDTAFLMGNEGTGIHEKQMKACDAFVKIPQYGVGTASLNVYVSASIVLHRYYHWSRLNQNQK